MAPFTELPIFASVAGLEARRIASSTSIDTAKRPDLSLYSRTQTRSPFCGRPRISA